MDLASRGPGRRERRASSVPSGAARPPSITVVVACRDGAARIGPCLAALERQARGRPVERIVVDASPEAENSAATAADAAGARLLRRPPSALVPRLWADGIDASSNEVVALTIAQCVPASGWLDRLAAQPWERVAGVGGTFELEPDFDPADLAVFLLRYSAWMPDSRSVEGGSSGGRAGVGEWGEADAATATREGAGPGAETCTASVIGRRIPVEDLAADNAAYRRDALMGCREVWASEGFWEPFVHRRLRREGKRLALDPGLRVCFRHQGSLLDMARERHAHGRWYATHRMQGRGAARRWPRALTAPALPLVLLRRIIGRTRGKPAPIGPSRRWIPALPHLMLLLAAWSTGEMAGYAAPRRGEAEPGGSGGATGPAGSGS